MAAGGMELSWWWNGGTNSLKLGIIWEMSVKTQPLLIYVNTPAGDPIENPHLI